MIVILGYDKNGQVVKSMLALRSSNLEFLKKEMVEQSIGVVRTEVIYPKMQYSESEMLKDRLGQMGYITGAMWCQEDFYFSGAFSIPKYMLNKEYVDGLEETASEAVEHCVTSETTIGYINDYIKNEYEGLHTEHSLTETTLESEVIAVSDVIDSEAVLVGDVVTGDPMSELRNISLVEIFSDEDNRDYIVINSTICYLDSLANNPQDIKDRLGAEVSKEFSKKLSGFIPDSCERESIEEFIEED